MLIKFFKIFFFTLLLIHQSSLYSKNTENSEFKSENLSNYFSALVSFSNQKNDDALKFFRDSKSLIERHDPYLKHYVNSLIIEGKVDRAIKEIKHNLGEKNSDFFEAYFLLILDSIKKKDFKKSQKNLVELSRFKENSVYELAIYESLKSYVYLFKNNKILFSNKSLGNISFINEAFQNCYLDKNETETYFVNLIDNNEIDYSRYIFFYINYLIEHNRYNEAKEITDRIDTLNSNLLILQTKSWIDKKYLVKFNKIFLCKNETDILSEFIFLIANLYSSQNYFEKSNFYLQISNFLNPKFNFNLSLLAENYFVNANYKKSEKVLNNFNKKDDIYYWYKIKKKTHIISKEEGEKQSFNFINSKFKQIEKPSVKILFDMANIAKGFKKYNLAIDYYSEVLSRIDENSITYSNILYRRGGSYERLGQFLKSDEDLLKSLEINPDDSYVLNYLAYSWLERDYKIYVAIEMLEKAYKKKKDDPFIIDSIGWAYYLIGDLVKAEQFLKKAVQLMPDDPIINDHYGDILWKLDRKMQAKYYWQSVLSFKDTEEISKDEIHIKLLKGPGKI